MKIRVKIRAKIEEEEKVRKSSHGNIKPNEQSCILNYNVLCIMYLTMYYTMYRNMYEHMILEQSQEIKSLLCLLV